MAGDEITIPVTGNLTADPELRFTQSGTAVANFTVASTPRIYDRQTNEWRDGETTFLKCTAWRETAENVAETLEKGTPVIVVGKLITKKFTTRDGDQRSANEIEVDAVGPNIRYGTAKFTKAARKGNQGGGGYRQGNAQPQSGGAPQGGQQGGQQAAANDDPWGGGSTANDDPWA